MDKSRALKLARNITLTIVVMLVLVVGAGVGYTWYMGQQPADPVANQQPTTPAPRDIFGPPPKPVPGSPVGASIQVLTSPVTPGMNASISVKTTPTAVCTITVTYDETKSTDSGLREKTADDYGVISWSWTVESTVPHGTWPVKVACTYGEKTGVVQGDLVVKESLED